MVKVTTNSTLCIQELTDIVFCITVLGASSYISHIVSVLMTPCNIYPLPSNDTSLGRRDLAPSTILFISDEIIHDLRWRKRGLRKRSSIRAI